MGKGIKDGMKQVFQNYFIYKVLVYEIICCLIDYVKKEYKVLNL